MVSRCPCSRRVSSSAAASKAVVAAAGDQQRGDARRDHGGDRRVGIPVRRRAQATQPACEPETRIMRGDRGAGAATRRSLSSRASASSARVHCDAGRMRSYQGRPRSALRGPTCEHSATWADRATSSLAGSSLVAPPCPDSPDAPMPCLARIPPASSIDIAALPGSKHQHCAR